LGRACSAIAQAIGSDDLHPREFGVASDAETRRREKLVGVLSDWHMLCFLDTCGILDADDMKALCRVATTHDAGEALDALLSRTGWQTLSAIAREHAPQGPSAGAVEQKSKTVGDMMGMSGSGGTSARAANPVTPRAAKPAAPAAAPAAPARAPAAAVMGSGRADDPLIYNGDDDDDIELNSDDDDDDELEYADDDMFEDAASSAGAHEVAPARARSPPPPEQDDDMGTAAAGGKACPHCTFINERSSGDCDVCGLPLSG
jgi:nuclear protein localization family protein 4